MIWFFWALGLTLATAVGTIIVRRARFFGVVVFVTLMCCYVLSANILVPRLVEIEMGYATLVVASGSLIWPFTSQISDMINEIYGRRYALSAVALAYLMNLLFVTFIYAVGSAEPVWSAQQEDWWRDYFFASGRILLASSTTFLIIGFLDVIVFAWLKRLAQHVEEGASTVGLAASAFLRSAASDGISMAADSVLFASLAFAFTMPWSDLGALILGSIGLKVTLAVVDTPWFIAFKLATRRVERADLQTGERA
jgi:uncharacterized integral membrane protein (TIGR00697 family)